MKTIKRIKRMLDNVLLAVSLISLVVMVLVITYQVFMREIFSQTPAWSETLSRLTFVYVGFLGIAYGFHKKSHIALTVFVDRMPKWFQDICDYLSIALTLFLGVIMVYYGWNFTVLMSRSTLSGLTVPTSVLYVIMPLTGIFVTVNGLELLVEKITGKNSNDDTKEGA